MSERSKLQREQDEQLVREYKVSTDRIKELREIFAIIDKDSDGHVSVEELSTLIGLITSNYSEAQIKYLMNEADKNGDGQMGFNEFVRLMSTYQFDQKQNVSATREAFGVFDVDNDGYITKRELRQVMAKIGHDFNDEDIEEMLSEADKDGDGRVTFEEFNAMFKDEASSSFQP